tara:strand:- start:224 stop:727 length:504 start_codon:yes stop_codon:yes gene_type:complete
MSLISHTHAQRYRDYYARTEIASRPNRWQQTIEILAHAIGAESVLDYGCGGAVSLGRYMDMDVRNYDPGLPEHAAEPEPADIVVCLDVLEHIETDTEQDVIRHLESLALKALFITVSCQESQSKKLPDGTPWHSHVRPQEYWRQVFAGYQEIACTDDRNQFICMRLT